LNGCKLAAVANPYPSDFIIQWPSGLTMNLPAQRGTFNGAVVTVAPKPSDIKGKPRVYIHTPGIHIAKAPPKIDSKPVATKADDKLVASKADDKPVASKADDKPVASKADDKPIASKADDKSDTPVKSKIAVKMKSPTQ
jgi:hypothetical protein